MDTTEDISRFSHPKMAYYRYVYRNSPKWDGKQSLENKTVIVYGEQGYGDIIQFVRYIPSLMHQKCRVIVHCPQPLHRLFGVSSIGHEWIDRDIEELPDHDFHIPSMSMPFKGLTETPSPYLKVSEKRNDIQGEFKVGIAWEGNPEHSNNFLRSCHLSLFQQIQELPHVTMYMLQEKINIPEFADVNENFQLFSVNKTDFYDTATLINSMDLIISVDTSVLHLAGALGKENVYGLLSNPCDARWEVKNWYPNTTLIHDQDGNWTNTFRTLERVAASKNTAVKIHRQFKTKENYDSILVTGGIGDFIALESHMNNDLRKRIKRIYLATRADQTIEQLARPIFNEADIVKIFSDYTKMTFYQKTEVAAHLKAIKCPFPSDWRSVEDWSILVKFDEINRGKYRYHGTKIFDHINDCFDWDNYIVVCPMTNTERDTGRDFDQKDWQDTINRLEITNKTGIVIAGERVEVPNHHKLINLSGQTSLFESIGILKKATGYIGIDSFLSILAAQRFNPPNILVKSINPHLYKYSNIYYAPHEDRSFIKPRL
jgi:ADP-heptose:LPS heptosyltransferase